MVAPPFSAAAVVAAAPCGLVDTTEYSRFNNLVDCLIASTFHWNMLLLWKNFQKGASRTKVRSSVMDCYPGIQNNQHQDLECRHGVERLVAHIPPPTSRWGRNFSSLLYIWMFHLQKLALVLILGSQKMHNYEMTWTLSPLHTLWKIIVLPNLLHLASTRPTTESRLLCTDAQLAGF